MLATLLERGELRARAAYGFFPANAAGDDVELYRDASRSGLLGTLHTLRQQGDKGESEPCQALADFVAPRESGKLDWLGAFAVTAGVGADALVAVHEKAHDDYSAIMVKALADRLAEAFAEWLHRQRAGGLGLRPGRVAEPRGADPRALPGHPPGARISGLPRPHREAAAVRRCSAARSASGIRLTESFAMQPAASVCGFYFAHPQARYFALGKIGRDQVADYHRRKGMDLRAVERWLAPNLGYDPAD